MEQRVVESLPTAASEINPKKPKFEIEEDAEEEEISNFGELASPYLKPCQYNARFLNKQYGIRREDVGRFMTGDSILTVEDTSDNSING